jgi:CheY-like chemotaxis protein
VTVKPTRAQVLLVDDGEDNRERYSRFFRHHAIDMLTAADEESTIEIAKRSQPAVIVLDLGLPTIDGWEVARRLKVNQTTRDIPIVALSNRALADSKTRALAAGVDSLLTKPCFPEELLAEVRKLLR